MEWWNNFTNWLSGDDDYSESAFSDTDEDFEDFYNEVTNNSDYSNNLYTDDSYDPNEIFSDYGEEDYLASEEGPFAWLYESDPEFVASVLGDDWMGGDQYGWNEDETSYIYPDDYSGSGFEDLIASNPEFAAFYNEVTNNSDYSDNLFMDDSYDPNEVSSNYGGNPVLEFLNNLISGGGGGGGKKTGGGIMNLLSSLAGGTKNMLDNDLIKMLLAKKLLDDDREGSGGYVPIGQEAYGGGSPLPDYRISNIQPALLPGMAYANQPTTFNNMPPPTAPPPGMQAGGIASLENRMEGPGDITQAMLEPGEFVMTRKATQNLTPEYLYSLMHQAENAGRMR